MGHRPSHGGYIIAGTCACTRACPHAHAQARARAHASACERAPTRAQRCARSASYISRASRARARPRPPPRSPQTAQNSAHCAGFFRCELGKKLRTDRKKTPKMRLARRLQLSGLPISTWDLPRWSGDLMRVRTMTISLFSWGGASHSRKIKTGELLYWLYYGIRKGR